MSKVTMDALAAELGISKNTVSRALRDLPGVSDDMRQRIFKLAGDSGYKLKSKEKLLLHVVMIYRKRLADDMLFWPSVIGGIMDYAADRNISIRTVTVDSNSTGSSLISAVSEQKCDGLLVVNDIDDAILSQLAGLQLPMVVVDYHSNAVDCDYVNTDNKKGIYKALSHLIDNNHRKLGFIGNADHLFSFRERFGAFRYYMRKNNLPLDERFIWLDSTYEDYTYLRDKIDLLKNCGDPATAFICVNDVMAAIFAQVLGECGYKIPEDVSIVGFDNISFPIGAVFTTVEVQKRILGQRALEQLLLRVKLPEKPYETLHINTTLVIRGSVKRL